MKNLFQILTLIFFLVAGTINGQSGGGLYTFAANEININKFNVERKPIMSDWKTISSVKISNLTESPKNYSFNDPSAIINYNLPFDILQYGQTSLYVHAAASTKDNFAKPYNLNELNQGKNIASDLFLKYGDNILAMVAGYFQGKGEAYRVTIEYGGPLTKVYSLNQLSSRWHSFAVYKTSFDIGTACTVILSGRNDFWRGVIQSATCLSLNNLISDGVYNNAKGFTWFRQSNDTGWGLEKTLTPGVKLGILTALVALRIVYEVWLNSD